MAPNAKRPDWDLTALEFAVRHPDKLTREHYGIVLQALLDGHKVRAEVLQQYPIITITLAQYQGKDLARELRALLKVAKGNKLAPRSRR